MTVLDGTDFEALDPDQSAEAAWHEAEECPGLRDEAAGPEWCHGETHQQKDGAHGEVSGDARVEVEVETTADRSFLAPAFPDAAMPGVLGDLVRLWEPWTEAHPASIVLPVLVMLGVHGGEGVRVGKQRAIEYLALIGPSTVGRKDSGVGIAADFAELVGGRRPTNGAANSGEGIFFAIRDPLDHDPGAPDKRLCLLDTEMAATLAASHRQGATLLPTLLSLYDDGSREPLTKRDRVKVTNGHFAYVGLTVPEQFALHVTDSDRHSGFLQRLLIGAVHCVRRVPPSRALDPKVDPLALSALADAVRERMDKAVRFGRIWRLSQPASEYLDTIGDKVVDSSRPETARGIAHVLRLAMLFALTVPPDPSDATEREGGLVTLSHVLAGEAAWGYCSASAALVLANDNLLDKIVMLASDAQEGLTRTDLFRMTSNNITAAQLDDAIRRGCKQGKLRVVERRTGKPGRPPLVIMAAP